MRRSLATALFGLLIGLSQAQTPSAVLVLPSSSAAQARSSSIQALADGRVLVVNPLSDTLALLDGRGRVVSEVALGAGSGPTALSLSADGRAAVVLESLGESIVWVDLRQQAVLRRAPWPERSVLRRVLALGDDQAWWRATEFRQGAGKNRSSLAAPRWPCGAGCAWVLRRPH